MMLPEFAGVVVGSIPDLLTFWPENSVVLVEVRRSSVSVRLGSCARADLVREREHWTVNPDDVGYMAAVMEQHGVASVVAVVVAEAVPDEGERNRLSAQIVAAACGVEVLDSVVFVSSCEFGAEWVSASGVSGLVSEVPGADARRAVMGRPAVSRAALVEEMEPVADAVGVARVNALRGEDSAAALEFVCGVVEGYSGSLDDDTVARLGAAMLDLRVRDAVVGLALTDGADEALRVFQRAACRLSGEPRAAAATVAATLAFAAGDGPRTGIALAAALEASPGYRMAVLVSAAFDGGMTPDEMMGMAAAGISVAERLGVRLPSVRELAG